MLPGRGRLRKRRDGHGPKRRAANFRGAKVGGKGPRLLLLPLQGGGVEVAVTGAGKGRGVVLRGEAPLEPAGGRRGG